MSFELSCQYALFKNLLNNIKSIWGIYGTAQNCGISITNSLEIPQLYAELSLCIIKTCSHEYEIVYGE